MSSRSQFEDVGHISSHIFPMFHFKLQKGWSGKKPDAIPGILQRMWALELDYACLNPGSTNSHEFTGKPRHLHDLSVLIAEVKAPVKPAS